MAALPNPALLAGNGSYEVTVLPGRTYLVAINGTFGSGTVKIQYQHPANGAWYDIADASWTSAAEARVTAPGNRLQFVLSGATTPSIAVTVQLIP